MNSIHHGPRVEARTASRFRRACGSAKSQRHELARPQRSIRHFAHGRNGFVVQALLAQRGSGPNYGYLHRFIRARVLKLAAKSRGGGFPLAPVFGPFCTILKLSFMVNVFLAFFNLIPIPPLDGSWVLE
ncbi:MAG: site-2 protease family protein, partial [Planctomycetes bacterium]|nr:site-2 protease family protein [Planctomycetota bacterium]